MKFETLRNAMENQPIFTNFDLVKRGFLVWRAQLTHWTKKGLLTKLRNGVYALGDASDLPLEIIAYHLYQPSYLTLEWALFHYSLMPDAPYQLTSVTPKTTRLFNSDFGRFSYQTIKSNLYFGYEKKIDKSGKLFYLLAEPEKALLDFFYLHSSMINNEVDLKNYRFNPSWREIIDETKLKLYAGKFKSAKLNKIVELFTNLV